MAQARSAIASVVIGREYCVRLSPVEVAGRSGCAQTDSGICAATPATTRGCQIARLMCRVSQRHALTYATAAPTVTAATTGASGWRCATGLTSDVAAAAPNASTFSAGCCDHQVPNASISPLAAGFIRSAPITLPTTAEGCERLLDGLPDADAPSALRRGRTGTASTSALRARRSEKRKKCYCHCARGGRNEHRPQWLFLDELGHPD